MDSLNFASLLATVRNDGFAQTLKEIERGCPHDAATDPRGCIRWLSDTMQAPGIDFLADVLAQGPASPVNHASFFAPKTGLLSFIAQSAQASPGHPHPVHPGDRAALALHRGEVLCLLCNIFLGSLSPTPLLPSLQELRPQGSMDLSCVHEEHGVDPDCVFQTRCLLSYFHYMKENPRLSTQVVSYTLGTPSRAGMQASAQGGTALQEPLGTPVSFADSAQDLSLYESADRHAWIVPCEAEGSQGSHIPQEFVQMFLSPESLLVHFLRMRSSQPPGIILVGDVLVVSCTPMTRASQLECNPLRTPLSRRDMAFFDTRSISEPFRDEASFCQVAQGLANVLLHTQGMQRVHATTLLEASRLSICFVMIQWLACNLAGGVPMTVHYDPSCLDASFHQFMGFVNRECADPGAWSIDAIMGELVSLLGKEDAEV